MKKEWKKFEETIFNIQKQLSSRSNTIYNHKVDGIITERQRQIDVAMFDTIGSIEIFIAVECKDYSTPVDVKEIEAFLSKLEDIRADKGIMVSSNGFTRSARNYAIKKRIQLYTLTYEKPDFDIYIEKLVLLKEMTHYLFNINYMSTDLMNDPSFDIESMILYTSDGKFIRNINHFILEQWNSGELPADIGKNDVSTDKVKILHFVKQYPVVLELHYLVKGEFYYKKFKLVELENYENILENELVIQNKLTEEYFAEDPIFDDTYRKITSDEIAYTCDKEIVEARVKFII